MPRKLALRPDCLEAPTIEDTRVVGAMMLIPHDANLRDRVDWGTWLQYLLWRGDYPQPQNDQERDLLMKLIRAPRPDYLDIIKKGFARGMIVGQMLLESIAEEGITLDTIKRRLAFNFRNDRISVKTIENTIWPQYKCVAAYWATYQSRGSRIHGPIPCEPSVLGQFLAAAAMIKKAGEEMHVRRSPRTLLLPGETVEIPAEIKLPPSPLRFRRPSAV